MLLSLLQKQSPGSVVKSFTKFTRKQSVSETLFNKVTGLQSENRLRRRCLPMNFEKFLGTYILKTTTDGCFYYLS